MSELIERYIYDVVRRLPEKVREEVSDDLRANIFDMLSEEPSEQEVIIVLKDLGNPRRLANNYRGKQRYLISPEWMDDYLVVLKIVLIVFAILAAIAGVISHSLDHEATRVFGIIVEVFANTVNDVVSALFTGFGIVTLVFVVIDKYKKVPSSEFDIKSLPELPERKSLQISRTAMIISIIFNIIFGSILIYLLYYNKVYIGWIGTDGGYQNLAPLFKESIVLSFLPFFIISLFITVGAESYKLIAGQWTTKVTLFHTIGKIVSGVIAIIFLRSVDLINAEFIAKAASVMDLTNNQVSEGITRGLNIFTIFLAVIIVIDILSTWWKTLNIKPIKINK